MARLALDIGYDRCKAAMLDRLTSFPSVVGSVDRSSFGLSADSGIVLEEPFRFSVGDLAVSQSRFLNRREDRGWVGGDEWMALAYSAITELTTASRIELSVITGLPVAFYADRPGLIEKLKGEHRIKREGRAAQVVSIKDVKVIPQPFGTPLYEALNDSGEICNKEYLGQVGIIDVGSKTVNFLLINKLTEVARGTTSSDNGAWTLMRSVRSWLQSSCPGLEAMRDHELSEAVKSRKIRWYGEEVRGFRELVETQAESLSREIASQAGQLWNGGALLDAILVTGGGALLLGDHICKHWKHARIVSDPVFANVKGYLKFSQRAFKEA